MDSNVHRQTAMLTRWAWWCDAMASSLGMQESDRRRVRRQVMEMFNHLDKNGDGSLDLREIQMLTKQRATKRSLKLLNPPFDLARCAVLPMRTHVRISSCAR